MDSALGALAPNPGDAGGSGAIRQTSADAADVDRPGQRHYLNSSFLILPLLPFFPLNS